MINRERKGWKMEERRWGEKGRERKEGTKRREIQNMEPTSGMKADAFSTGLCVLRA